ncbi:3'-5' exonuclease [Mucilaginibacter terrae]|uniref:DNA polymerase elongation subunit (Family B) n=1 Tax=Mucilaginibacter terrae TaxID=1955052 RepID=A0ABU3GT87_9SPHI|nr:3'-5' exonuclease [Mucilaginibacter terrae]MDT3401870.1 DNA polymerase elongation subunit (family B) [Mucilaginibacter terrae]
MLDNLDWYNLMVIDIETVPQYSSYAEVPEHLKVLWDKKTTYQRKEETSEDFYRNAGIQAEFGKIICISVGMFTREGGFRVKSFASHNEEELLSNFATMLSKRSHNLVLCGHNAKEFDFPYMCRRMLVNGIRLPLQLQIAGKKPWEICHLDTMELWKFGDYKNFTSLNLMTAIFNIPTPKDDIDGSMVGHVYWIDNQLERICIYCQKDVVATAQLLKRFKGEDLIDEDMITIVD